MIEKEVKKSRSKKNFNFIVFSLIKQGKSPTDICSMLGFKKMANLSYYLTRLRANGSIKKAGYGTWEAIDFKQKEVKKIKVGDQYPFIKPTSSKNRGHAFQFKIALPRLANWFKREDYLNKEGIEYSNINKGYTQRIIYKGHKVWLNKRTIVCYFSKGTSFFGDNATQSEDRAIREMISIMDGLSNILKISLKIGKFYKIRVSYRHHAHIRNALARLYNDNNKKMSISNEDGQWLLIDDSFKLDELETTGNKGRNDALIDQDFVVIPFFNSLKDHHDQTGESFSIVSLMQLLKQNEKAISEITMRHFDMQTTMQQIVEALKQIQERLR